MNQPIVPPPLTVVHLRGQDAVRVANNLCTAPLGRLQPGQGCESFFTDVRGKTLGHFCVYRSDAALLMIGAAGQGERLVGHLDRYIIREDAAAEDLSANQAAVLLPPELIASLPAPLNTLARTLDPLAAPPQPGAAMPPSPALAWLSAADGAETDIATDTDDIDDAGAVTACQVPWWAPLPLISRSVSLDPPPLPGGDGGADAVAGSLRYAVLVIAPPRRLQAWLASPAIAAATGGYGFGDHADCPPADETTVAGTITPDEAVFHARRIAAGFPWYGLDLDESNLPQELDRDLAAVSFSKGCYLGQETVARLDALGQVQKKLVRWEIEAAQFPPAGTGLTADGKIVGRLTSVTASDRPGHWLALGFARRSHFEPPAVAHWLASDGGQQSASDERQPAVLGTAHALPLTP